MARFITPLDIHLTHYAQLHAVADWLNQDTAALEPPAPSLVRRD